MLVWNVVTKLQEKVWKQKRKRSMKECLLLTLIDPAGLFITPWTPASVSYITAKPSLTDGHEWGEKNGCKILLDALGEKQGRGCDGWLCLTQAGWKAEMGLFQMRHGVCRAPAPLPRASQSCQDERQLAKLPLSVLLSLVSKQRLSIFNRYNWTSRDGNTEFLMDLMSAWG